MTLRGQYAKGAVARRRILRAAARSAADPESGMDLGSIAKAVRLTTGGVSHHFPNRDALLVAAAIELDADPDIAAEQHVALTRELIRIACDRNSRSAPDADRRLRELAREADAPETQHLGSLLVTALNASAVVRPGEDNPNGE